nr:hypothetical protein [Tanacetum cinerariifolium]
MEGTYMEKEEGAFGNMDYDTNCDNDRIKENDKLESVKTYANAAQSHELKFDTSLLFKQTKIRDDGEEIAIFDDDYCEVFGHSIGKHKKRPRTVEEIEMETQMVLGMLSGRIGIFRHKKRPRTVEEIEMETQMVLGMLSGRIGIFRRPRTVEEIEMAKKKDPTNENMTDRDGFRNWSQDMIKYFKDKWEEDRMKENDLQNEEKEDVMENRDGIAGMCAVDEIQGNNDSGMANEAFIEGYPQAFVNFLPYLTSDHSASVLVIPNGRTNEVSLLVKYMEVVEDEEKLLYQMARIEWLRKGDKNSRYFHKMIKGRKSMNKMVSICDEHSNRYEGDKVANKFVEHFSNFLGKKDSVKEMDNMEELFTSKLYDNEAMEMIKEKMVDWIMICVRKAAFSISINGDRIRNFKSKRRIKNSLHKLVNLNQGAFIPGRLIQDNLLITQEVLKGYNKKNGPKRCALKIDIAKAYDIVDWDFRHCVLIQFVNLDFIRRWWIGL